MTNQEIVDRLDEDLHYLPVDIRELILDAVWQTLCDHLGIDLDI
jgi:hypothetical protein